MRTIIPAMKKPFFIFPFSLFIFLLSSGFSSCQKENTFPDGEPIPISLSANQKALVENGQGFAFDLLREVTANADQEENVFISPLSVSLALAMTYNGAGGSTQTAMHQAMQLPELPAEKINEAWQQLMKDLLSVDKKVLLTIANSIWYDQQFHVEPPFINANKKYYDAEVRALDFTNAGAVDIINQWVADNTNNLILKIIDNIPQDAVMYLVNAIYFKGQWTYEFDPADTAPQTFYLGQDDTKQVDMMRQSASFNHYSNDLFSVAELPYGRGNYSMVVVLPHSLTSVNAVAESINQTFWNDLPGLFTETELVVIFPKLKFAFEQKLKEALTSMGMGLAFAPGMADFSGINPMAELFINEVFHKAFVEVNEEGTEAAAVTAVEVSFTSIDPNTPVYFNVNRPFLFFIRETTTNTIIFAGRIMEPVTE